METNNAVEMLLVRHSDILASRGLRAACLESADTLRSRHAVSQNGDARRFYARMYAVVLECLRSVDAVAADRQAGL